MKLFDKIQRLEGTHFEQALKTVLLILIAFYFFWLPSFSDRYPFNIGTYPLVILIAGICGVCLIIKNKLFFVRDISFVLIIYLSISLLSTLLSIKVLGLSGLREWLRLAFLFTSFLLFFNAFKLIGKFEHVVFAIFISMFLFTIYFILIYYKDIILILKGSNKRLGSYFNNVNTLSSYFAIGYLLGLYQFFYFKNKLKILCLGFCCLFVFIGFTTGSRQFLLSLFVDTFLFLIWFFRHKKVFLFITLGAFITSVVLIFTIPVFSFIKNKFLFLFNFAETKDLSAIQRLLMQINALFEGGNHFIFGHGQLGFSAYTSFNGYSHNSYTNAYFESGILGLMSLLTLLILIFKNAYSLKEQYFCFALLFLIYYFIVGFFSVWFREKPFYVLLALICFTASEPTFKKEIRMLEIKI